MKVAIDSGVLLSGHSVRGVGTATKNLIESVLKYNNDKSIVIDPVDFSSSDLTNYDVLHYTSFNPFFVNYPKFGSLDKKIVLTIHDLIPLVYEKKYSPGIRGKMRFYQNKYLVRKVDQIVTVSETSKKDIVRFLGVNDSKINVVYWASDPVFRKIINKEKLARVKRKYNLPDKFVLYVGDVNYNKNLSTLIKACKNIKVDLVIAGKQAANLDDSLKQANKLQGPMDFLRSFTGKLHPEVTHLKNLYHLIQNSPITLTGYVKDEDLAGIYNLASVYFQPSYYEGFGLTVLEAFACETPVIISKTQALVEIADGATLIADPHSTKDFSDKIFEVFNDPTKRLHLMREGQKRIKDFSWNKTANETIEVYKKCI